MHLLLKSGIQEMANPSSKLQVTQQFSNALSEYQHHKIHNSTGNCYPKFSHSGSTPLTHYPSSSLLLPNQIFRNSVNPTKETRGGKKIPQQEDGALFDRLTRQPGGLQRRGRERWSRRNGTRPIMTQPLCYYYRCLLSSLDPSFMFSNNTDEWRKLVIKLKINAKSETQNLTK